MNRQAKKQAMDRLKSASEQYAAVGERVKQNSVALFELRQQCSERISLVEVYVNTLANTPKEFESTFADVTIHMERFQAVLDLEFEDQKTAKVSGSVAGAGIAAGAGVAAFGPTAAMAMATTFGTASTGTAISALSGAAATKAALAWLGGGAMVAGGGGMAAGKALLALAGPVGWAIGGTALVGGALYARKKNKDIAEQAQTEALNIQKQIAVLEAADVEIAELHQLTDEHQRELYRQLQLLEYRAPQDYLQFTTAQKQEIGALVNNTLALSALLNKNVGKAS